MAMFDGVHDGVFNSVFVGVLDCVIEMRLLCLSVFDSQTVNSIEYAGRLATARAYPWDGSSTPSAT
jgi:hypothetical protein